MKFYKIAALSILASVGSFSARADTNLVVSCFFPPQHHICQKDLPEWLSAIEKATDGRVRGMITPTSVAPPPEQLASVESGLADVAIQFNGLITNRVVGPQLAMIPFTSPSKNAEIMSKALWETNNKFFPDEFNSVQLLSLFVGSPSEIYSMTSKPVESIRELQGTRTWTPPGNLATLAKSTGAGVVATPAVQANEIVSRGVVDAAVGPEPSIAQDVQLIPYIKSMTEFPKAMYVASFSVVMNKDKWAEISTDDQKRIMKLSGENLASKISTDWDSRNEPAFQEMRKQGVKFIQASPEFEKALEDASSQIKNKWIADAKQKGIDGEKAYDFYVGRIEELMKK